VVAQTAPRIATAKKKLPTTTNAGSGDPDKESGKNWRPPARKSGKALTGPPDKGTKKKSWAVQFLEFRGFGECVLDYLRSQAG
jgi:hypothetical protein